RPHGACARRAAVQLLEPPLVLAQPRLLLAEAQALAAQLGERLLGPPQLARGGAPRVGRPGQAPPHRGQVDAAGQLPLAPARDVVLDGVASPRPAVRSSSSNT